MSGAYTLGKLRHLTRCSTQSGHFVVLAIDHRANLRALLEPISDEGFRQFKADVIGAAEGLVSGVLTDPAYGLGPLLARGSFAGGLLAPLEVTDYDVHPSQRELDFIPNWSVSRLQRVGGDGAKLLLPFHPQLPSAAAKRESVARIVEECAACELPFFLEPIACSLRPEERLTGEQQRVITLEMVDEFCALGVDVLKLQLPAAEEQWEATCRGLAQRCTVPWALLSGGVDFPTYCRQTEVACAYGASGVIVGRAVWSEATSLGSAERSRFLASVVPERLARLGEIVFVRAAPWRNRVSISEPSLTWYEA